MTHRSPRARLPLPFALALGLAVCGPSAVAQPLPDAGQLLREQVPRPERAAPALPRLGLPEPAPEPAVADGGVRFRVDTVVLQGNTAFTTDALLALVADLPGEQRTLADAEAAARRITAHYRARGYPVARAYVPAQDITDGRLRIEVLEGRIDRTVLDNRSRLDDAVVSMDREGLRDGDTIASAPIDRALQILLDTPGVGGARATLQPGDLVGTSRLDIALDPSPLVRAGVVLDNFGSEHTGRVQRHALLALDSPLGRGDRWSLFGSNSGPGFRFVQFKADLPIGSDGTRATVVHDVMDYRLGAAFASLQASGDSQGTGLRVRHPWLLTRLSRVDMGLEAERRSLQDRKAVDGTLRDRSLVKLAAVVDGRWTDVAQDRVTTARVKLVSGRLRIHDAADAAQDAAAPRAQGRFALVDWDLSHLHRVAPAAQVYLSYRGQRSNRNLDSAEKFGIGGPYAVRAFAAGEARGDHADLFGVEWRQQLSPVWQGQVFYDIGRVRLDHSPYDATTPRHRTLSGAGIGLKAEGRLGGTTSSVHGTLAWPLSSGPTTDVPVDRPVLWLTWMAAF